MMRDRIKGTFCRLRVNEADIPSVIFGPERKELTKQRRKFFSELFCHVGTSLSVCLPYDYSMMPISSSEASSCSGDF
jgi:hypothetical protein